MSPIRYNAPMLDALVDDIYTTTAPQTFFGLHVGTRCTVVRLPSGGLWVHSPTPLTDGLRADVDALGTVEHIVAPNVYHHLYAGEWTAAWPGAALHAPEALAKKRRDLAVTSTLSETLDPGWGGVLRPSSIDGSMMHETVFLHEPTRTLISSDLLENFETSDHTLTRWYLKAAGIHGKPGWSRILRVVYRDRRAARASIDRICEQRPERLVVAHGEVVERDAVDVIRKAFEWL
jgi:hypothetical protein